MFGRSRIASGVAVVVGVALVCAAGGGRVLELAAQSGQAPPPQTEAQAPQTSSGPPGSGTKFSLPTVPSNRIPPLPSEPILLETIDYTIRVVPLASGLERPWSIAFLPDGNILVTEITGKLRIVRPTGLDPRPIAGVPDVRVAPYEGLHDVVLHPRFPENRWLYLSYTKPGPDGTKALAISRGRFDGTALTNVEDIFVAQPWLGPKSGPSLGSRLAFDRDGLLYMAAASPAGAWQRAQDPNDHAGKVLRLRDDGSVPPDNPFVGRQGHRPEIYTMGHRSPLGLAMHPDTGEMFENENGPQGGDEINVLKPGGNYGWPVVSEGRDYGGRGYPTHVSVPGMEPPLMIWIPAIAISGMTFYTADAPFPRWKGNLFVGSLAYAHLERLTFNAKGEPSARDSRAREWLLLDLKQRIRDVRQGPDGLLYVVTDAMDGHLLRIEPAR